MEINLENSSKLFEKYKYLLIKTISSFNIYDKDEALDEAREVFMDAIEKYDKSQASFGGYVKYRLYYHFLDKSKRKPHKSLNDLDQTGTEIMNNIEANIDIEKEMERKEKYEELYKAIRKLKQKDKVIVYMKYWENRSHKEIGKALGITAKTVTNRHHDLLIELRKGLEGKI